MRDALVMMLLVGGIGLTLYRAWLGVLALAFFGYANPHKYAWGFTTQFPVYQILLAVAFLAFFQTRDRQSLPRDWRIPTFYLLWSWFLITTIASPLGTIAWNKLWEVSKVYIPLILTLYLINDRRKLTWLLITIGFSFGLLAAKGGVFAIQRGFAYRVWGPDGSMYGGNNEFSIATLMAIPLLMIGWFELRKGSGWQRWLARLAIVIVPLAFASAISSWSRGGLVAMAALYLFLWLKSRHKILLGLLAAGIVWAAPHFLPDELLQRWQTIETYEEDGSAMNRIEAWQDGLAYVKEHPVLGAGFDGWRYVTKRDWHSSYIEILSEHGVPGALLWGALILGSLFSLQRLARRAKRDGDASLHYQATMLQASMIAYLGGSLTLGITYWDFIYQLVFCAVLLKHFATQPASEPVAEGSAPSLGGTLPETRRV